MNSLPNQKEFISFLAGLAPDDETALIVRQKLKGNRAETYQDGMLKSTWIPFLPNEEKKIGSDWAVYGNTASFIPDRMKDKLSASTANCEFVLCMVLDDIGTKSKTPPLEPTWKMETSEGSAQWGYAFRFEDQPTKGEFAAAIKAIADAGFTDAGAINPVRNFRLPDSVNLKPGRNGFKSRLLDFHRDREFTLKEICEALGVTPGEPHGNGYEPTKIKRTDDKVLQWLSEKGLLLSQPNHDGWCGVVCPNHQNHSVPEDAMARYNTNDRGFVCYHEHCADWTSQSFLDWVAEQGGPSVTHGIDDRELVSTLVPALGKLGGDPEAMAAAMKSLSAIEDRQIGRVTKSELFERFAYLASDDAYFDLLTRREYPRNVFNATYRHLDCRSIHNGAKVLTSVFFDENRERKGAQILNAVTYAPGENAIVVRKEGILGNKWIDGRPTVNKTINANIDRWIEHGRKLISSERELQHIFDVMAFKLQHPEVKINHAILHAGREGCGKDSFWAPFIWAVCGPDADNRGYLDSSTLNTPWGYHLESEVLLINELREPTMSERQALSNRLKPIIAAPPDHLDVNRKSLHPYKASNRTFVLAFSNSRTPISLSSQDRRWFVIWSEAPRMTTEEANALWDWYKKDNGFEEIAAWLYRRDVSAFYPAATPFETDYKQMLIEGGMSTAQAYLVHIIKEGIEEFQSGVVGSPFYKIADRLQGKAPAGTKLHHAAIVEALQDAGWQNLGHIKSKNYSTKKQVWVSQKVFERVLSGEMTKSDARNMVELPPTIHVINLKKEA